MNKDISISDEVYDRLKHEKGDRSFSEVIADLLDANSRLADVAGAGILEDKAVESARRDIERLSEGTVGRLDDKTG